MAHALEQNHPLHAAGRHPLTASLRYRCECGNKEVLTIQVVMDMDMTEDRFVWTMRQLWKDVRFEVAQHIKDGGK